MTGGRGRGSDGDAAGVGGERRVVLRPWQLGQGVGLLVTVPVLEGAVDGGRGGGGRARRCAVEGELGGAITDGVGKAGAGICSVELCVLQEATKVGPRVCEAAEAGVGIKVGCALCVELCLEVEDSLECGLWEGEDRGDSCWLAEMTLRRWSTLSVRRFVVCSSSPRSSFARRTVERMRAS